MTNPFLLSHLVPTVGVQCRAYGALRNHLLMETESAIVLG